MTEQTTNTAFPGELTSQERECLQSFLQQCKEKGVLERPVFLAPDDVVDGLNDEITLLRFLRGRSFDVPGALKQFEEAQTIRTAAGASSPAAYDTVDITEFERVRAMYPRWSGRRTKTGLPICVFDMADLNPAALSDYSKKRSTSLATVHLEAIVFHDYLTRFVLPLCAALSPDGQPVSSAVYLVDVSSFTLKQAWNVRGYAQDISKLLATCYPEVVERVYVLNAAPVFTRIWGVLKKLVDPRTAAKLVIVPPGEESVAAALGEVVDVASEPMRHWGGFDTNSGSKEGMTMRPRLDDALRGLLGVQELPEGPMKWVVDQGGNRVAVAVGTRGDGSLRGERVGIIRGSD